MLKLVRIDREMLARPEEMDRPACGLLPEFRKMWPALEGVPWFPALGDGACDNVGSGAVGAGKFSLMVGTTGAMRVIFEDGDVQIAPGLWCYRLDRRRLVMGGALSNGGEVYAWMKRSFQLPKDLEARLEAAVPGSHGLTVLPFLSGERSPIWRADVRAAFTGIGLNTEPFDLVRAALESVALRFRVIYGRLAERFGAPSQVIASGGALLNSPAWTQMMADALGRPVVACTEPEASSRGAALWVLEQLGVIENISAIPASLGATFEPRAEYEQEYGRLIEEQEALYRKLYGNGK
jgi:gluconokinase